MKSGQRRAIIFFSFFMFVAILVFVGLLSLRHYTRIDLTERKEHSLSDKTKKVLDKATSDIELIGFAREGMDEYNSIRRLFAAYEYYSKKIKTRLVDPTRYPSIAQKYNIKQFNTVVIQGYDRTQTVKYPNEENITNGINRLIEGKTRRIAWVKGHNERDYKDEKEKGMSILKENLEGENFEIQEINLLRERLDRSFEICFVAGPEGKFLEPEISALEEYLKEGGNLILFMEPFSDSGLGDFVKRYGIVLREDIVVDPFSKAQGGDFLLPVVVAYTEHGITRDFALATIFRTARSISVDRQINPTFDLTELAYTSKDSWAETDLENLFKGKVALEENDKRGPVCLMAIGEGRELPSDEKGAKGKLVVFGDVDFATNQFISLGGNRQLLMNTVNYLTSRFDFINIEKIHKPIQPLLLSLKQKRIIFWVSVVAIPLTVLGISLLMWLRRRPR